MGAGRRAGAAVPGRELRRRDRRLRRPQPRRSRGRGCASCGACCGRAGGVAVLEITRPSGPLRRFYSLWFDRVVPLLGRVLPGGAAYTYLPASVRRFPPPTSSRAAPRVGFESSSTDCSREASSRCTLVAPNDPDSRRDPRSTRPRRATSRSSSSASRRRSRAIPGCRRRRAPGARRRRQAAAAAARLPLRARGRARRVAAGIAVELVHMATLVHDDLIDGAEVRRGKASAWSVFGAGAARAAGDYLFARAFAELARRRRAVGGGARRRVALPRAGRGAAAAAVARPRHDGRELPRALRAEDGEAVRGGVRARRRRRPRRSASRSGSRSRSRTTSSTAPARRSRPARSPAPTCARARRRCRCCSRRARTRSSGGRWRAASSTAPSSASPRRARSSVARGRARLRAPRPRAPERAAYREELEALTYAVVDRAG